MGKGKGKHNDGMFKKVVTDGLRKQHTTGIAQGAYAMCKVVLDKATAKEKTADERLKDIIAFCKICTKTADDIAEQTNEQ